MAIATTSQPSAETRADAGYSPVPRQILLCLDRARVDIYIRNSPRAAVVLFREAGYELSRDRADRLGESCEQSLYVRTADFGDLCQQLFDSLDTVLEEDRLSTAERFELIQVAVSTAVERSYQSANGDSYVDISRQLGTQITSLIAGSNALPRDVFRLASHDAHTYVHVTNVTSLAVLLAERLGITDRAVLQEIAVASMLHDIGKRFIPQNILSKAGSLTAEERAIVQLHPQRGYEDLCDRPDLSFGQLMIVYQHHERIDGRGYPVGITGEEMHPWAKLVAVVDVFEALTGKRPYRRPTSIDKALSFLQQGAGTQFDNEVTQCWIQAMQTS